MSTDSKPDPATVLFEAITSRFEKAFARGWKHKLAETLGVPDTTVQGWLKAGRFSPAVEHRLQAVIASARYRRRLTVVHDRWLALRAVDEVVEMPDGLFSVAERSPTGELKVVASGIAKRDVADRLAQSRAVRAVAEWEANAAAVEAGAYGETSSPTGPFGVIDAMPDGDPFDLLGWWVESAAKGWTRLNGLVDELSSELADGALPAPDELNQDLWGWLKLELSAEDRQRMRESGALGIMSLGITLRDLEGGAG